MQKELRKRPYKVSENVQILLILPYLEISPDVSKG